ncbi:DEAD/DEAH box helicase family protein [Fusobacterium animalis]|uniref:Helicase ATP-binding domain-containing protein n=1 Tax=Fusobacterium animalis 4_8 TaxID=469607 RepID=R9RE02_9FUSO|nr:MULTISPECIES: DEAD/DEAH box helicase family protein [Fusobacterium]AGM23715.1 hypothetical protein HMPREF0409_00463 [Fusobacterium animalis 4_8]EEW95264.1 hypothetical protein HMPREF0406_00686 [Fusobacterium animalis 3_1_33]MCG6843845.1 DEAD/DEAH box helicase family protein [Fusobacterium nucleatum]
MADKIIFQFEELDYQKKAIDSVIKLFNGFEREKKGMYGETHRKASLLDPTRNKGNITESHLLRNLQKVQLENGLFTDNELANKNFTIEMETGTGKTYVYLRTILELYKEYGLKKFIVVVPSIPILKGVKKSIEQLREHFQEIEEIDITKYSFTYNSDKLNAMSYGFVESDDLSICIMNVQAFNKDSTRIRKEDEYQRILWNDIKNIRPIIIIDEPQKFEGQKKKKSSSLQAIDELEPLFILRYSATHKKLYNQIYKLDSYQAYKNNLVKKIKVKTINGLIPKDFPYIRYTRFSSELKAKIEIFSQDQGGVIRFKSFEVLGNNSLEELSGGLKQYKGMYIAENPHKEKPLKITTKNEDIFLKLGESNSEDLKDDEAIRIQIRLAIDNHFKKQFSILESNKKIKGLTLFFVDEVAKVRDSNSEDGRGKYLKIFDEEYEIIIKKYEKELEKYKEYFPNYQNVLQVREGYFAIDKKNNTVEIEGWDSSKDDEDIDIKTKAQEDIDRGIELILDKKDELISFKEPLAFIFSHSALREGWDNPNVFTICTLKKGSNDIAKKQEIGRGLRLPVDIYGNRCLDEDINELTIIVNDSYENFSSTLQADFNKNINVNEVTIDVLSKTLENIGIERELITPELVGELKEELVSNKIINSSNILNKDSDTLISNIEFKNQILKENEEKIKVEFKKLMVEKGSRRIEIKNGDNEPYVNKIRKFLKEEEFQTIYNNLYENLSKRTFYRCNIDSDEFISSCIEEINKYLESYTINKKIRITSSNAEYDDTEKFKLKKMSDKNIDIEISDSEENKNDFEIVEYIMYHTMLPRMAIFRIINGIEKRFALNNQDILESISQLILAKLTKTKAKNVAEYEVIEGYKLEKGEIFSLDNINEEDFSKEWKVFKANSRKSNAMNEYYKFDSEGEREFADSLEQNENILLFTKLKKGGFIIDTPYGNYSPDWAIIYKDLKNENKITLYFIVETKIKKEWENLTDIEQSKIKCAELHFKAISDFIKFDWVSSYENFKEKLNIKESTNV